MLCLEKILANLSAFFGRADDFLQITEFVKILSLPDANGSIQDLHLDFCPKREKHEAFHESYRQYFDQVCKIGCPHLSALHFPTGGAFSYIQGDIFSLNEGILKSLEYGATDYKKTVFFKKIYNCKY